MYTSISVQTTTKTVKLPTQAVYEILQKNYPATLKCPCTKISILYGAFVHVIPSFHQVCSSDFISQTWIDFAFGTNRTNLWVMDVRTSISAIWQLIASLCHSAKNTMVASIDQLASFPIVSSTILSENLLRTQIKSAIDLLHRTTSNSLVRSLLALRQITQANNLMTGLSTNYFVSIEVELGIISVHTTSYRLYESSTWCICETSQSCPMPGSLYLYEAWDTLGSYDLNTIIANETVSGIVIDCSPLQMMLASSLECFYNESCLNILLSAYTESINISVLNKSLPSNFLPTTNLEQLINELFIEDIIHELNYDLYYLQCAPIYCTYTYSHRFDWIYVITTLIALFGGLNVAFRLITPYLIDFALLLMKNRRRERIEPQQILTLNVRLTNLFRKVQVSIKEFNLFDNQALNASHIRYGRISTRLYLILLIIGILILTVYTFLTIKTVTKTILSPSLDQYEKLQDTYPNTLKCPCTVISIPYQELLQVTPTYHQVCGSDFVQSWWYENLFPVSNSTWASAFYSSASAHFRTLTMFCQLANLTIVDATHRFNATAYVNAQVLSRQLFVSQIDALIQTFINSTRTEFIYTMLLTNAIIHSNQYLTSLRSNTALTRATPTPFGIEYESPSTIITTTVFGSLENEWCSCAETAACNVANSIQDYLFWYTYPGVYVACYMVDSVMKSSLMCWYDNSCLEMFTWIATSADIYIPRNVSVLNDSLPSLFPPGTPLEIIVNELMVEKWNSSTFYTAFYQKCNPAYCSFTYEENRNAVYTVTTVIALFGGLRLILELISFLIFKIFFLRIDTCNPTSFSSPSGNQETIDRE